LGENLGFVALAGANSPPTGEYANGGRGVSGKYMISLKSSVADGD